MFARRRSSYGHFPCRRHVPERLGGSRRAFRVYPAARAAVREAMAAPVVSQFEIGSR